MQTYSQLRHFYHQVKLLSATKYKLVSAKFERYETGIDTFSCFAYYDVALQYVIDYAPWTPSSFILI